MLVDPPAEDWLMWRRTYGHWGHSPLDQINTTNVGGLRLAWAWTMREGRQETTPLVHDGMMFLVEPCDFVEALDVRDGSRIWEYRRDQVEHPANAVRLGGTLRVPVGGLKRLTQSVEPKSRVAQPRLKVQAAAQRAHRRSVYGGDLLPTDSLQAGPARPRRAR